MEERKTTTEQIRKMNHAIGFTPDKVRSGKYEAFRNRYIVRLIDDDLEQLCNEGLMHKREFEEHKQIGYFVTSKGYLYLSTIHNCQITELN